MRLNFRVGTLIVLGLAVLFPFSCSTEVDINAEPEDIWAIYGTLNPRDSIQDIRIASGFLPEGNAEDAAASLDLSLKGLLASTGIKEPEMNFCKACFDGCYPVDFDENLSKFCLEG